MAFKNLWQFINELEAANELIRIKTYVSPDQEIAEITDRIIKNNGPALLFENTGYDFPVLINSMGSEKRMCIALRVNNLNDVSKEIKKIVDEISSPRDGFFEKLKILPTLNSISSYLPKNIKGRGSCQEVIMEKPDIDKLPVLKCWPKDGGKFITLPVVHTKDLETANRNIGMYRMQIFKPDLTGMHWHLHKNSARHFFQYKKLNKKMPVVVTLGGDPVYTYVATAPLPDNFDEYIFAGFLRKKKVELVKCLTNELEIPADVDFVIEGYVDPSEDFILEGPFGDHTGFYSLEDYYPKFHITCITHRKNAVYPATIVGIPPQEDAWIGKATERIFLMPIKLSLVPEIKNINMPVEGVFHNITIFNFVKSYPGQALKIMNSLWGAGQMMFNKIFIGCDEDVNIDDYFEVAKAITENTNPLRDVIFTKGPADVLDHSCDVFTFGSKIGIDASKTKSLKKIPKEKKPLFIEVEKILKTHPEIKAINSDLTEMDLSFLIISIKKNKKNHALEISKEIVSSDSIKNIKFIVFVDDCLDVFDLKTVVWISANNIDPERDCFFIDKTDGGKYPGIFIDATRKTKKYDGFSRPWPNIIVSDKKIIKRIDEKWRDLDIGDFLESPSNKYDKMYFGNSAVFDE